MSMSTFDSRVTRMLAVAAAVAVAVVALLLGVDASAQIRIGQTVDMSGPTSASVHESLAGVQLVLDEVNAKGGIGGKRIEIVRLDDAFDPARTVENARTLLQDQRVVALFMTRGTPNTQALLPLLEAHRAPLIAPSTGAIALHSPVRKYVFNVRPPYQHEVLAVIDHLHAMGIHRVAVVVANDAFGDDVLRGVRAGLSRNGLQPVLVVPADRMAPDHAAIAAQLATAMPQAVLWAGAAAAVAAGVQALRSIGSPAQVITLSNNASQGFIKMLGGAAGGVIVTQVFPDEDTPDMPIVQEAGALARRTGIASLSPAMLEGYAAAKVLVEAVRRASPNPTREKVQAALESIRDFDLGGLRLSYSPTDHSGIEYTDLSMVVDGRFRR